MNYKSYILIIFLFVFLIQIIKLSGEKNELISINKQLLKNQKSLSESIIIQKQKEIDSLKQDIKKEEFIINQAIIAINDLQSKKIKVETIYLEKTKKINTLNENELKNYFYEELK